MKLTFALQGLKSLGGIVLFEYVKLTKRRYSMSNCSLPIDSEEKIKTQRK